MTTTTRTTRRASVMRLAAVLLLLTGLLVPQAVAQTPNCGPTMGVSDLRRGMLGHGLTVVQGSTPQRFDVEILGVLEDGILPGRDMIIVEVDAPFIDAASGIWQGMSGSPVYIGDALIGAVAYGLAFDSSGIGGLTPARDMIELVSLPPGEPSFAADGAVPAREVTLSGDLADVVLRRLDPQLRASYAQQRQAVSLRRLDVPLSVSGIASQRLDRVQQATDRGGLDVRVMGGASASLTGTVAAAPPVPGGNLAAALSLGDVTAAAIGTATLTCDGATVGFGHPFFAEGATLIGAAHAEAITIVPDEVFAPFKLANVGALFGTLDQDRFGGIRGRDGDIPPTIPIRSTIRDLDLARQRSGRTDVIRPDSIADLAFVHAFANVDAIIDRIGEGSSDVTVTVEGDASESGPFSYSRSNVFSSDFDISFESFFEMANQLFLIQDFGAEDVTIDDVAISAQIRRETDVYRIQESRLGVDGAPPRADVGEVVVQPGSVLDIEVDLVAEPSQEEVTVPLQLVVPDDAFGSGFLDITGGSGFFDQCFFDPEACGTSGEATLPGLLEVLADAPRNDELVARLSLSGTGRPFGGDGEEPPATEVPVEDGGAGPQPAQSPPPEPPPVPEPTPEEPPEPVEPPEPEEPGGLPGPRDIRVTAQLDRVVTGTGGFGVIIDSPFCPECPPVFLRAAGGDRIGTAAAIARQSFFEVDTVVIAPADDYPYALVAAPLGHPVLLTAQDGLAAESAAAITDFAATTALIVAPDGQLGAAVEDGLSAAGITSIQRLGGVDRYAVAATVAQRLPSDRAWLVEGENADPGRGWPDALAVGPVAAYEGAPILLTRAGELPPATAQVISDIGITSVSIAGGTAAVSTDVEAAVAALGPQIERLAGSTRYETGVLLTERQIELGAIPQSLYVVTGRDFPDGLAAGPAAAATGSTLLLVDGEDLDGSPAAREYLGRLQFTAPVVTFVGGFSAVSQRVEEQIFGVLTGTGGG